MRKLLLLFCLINATLFGQKTDLVRQTTSACGVGEVLYVTTGGGGACLAGFSFNAGTGVLTVNSVTGSITGNVTGNLTGNVLGNVTGALTGNADTATALAANPTGCGVGQFAAEIDAQGNLTCTGVAIGEATSFYFHEEVDGVITDYQQMLSVPSDDGESTLTAAVTSGTSPVQLGVTGTAKNFITLSGVPGTTILPSGTWQFEVWAATSSVSGSTSTLYAEVYKRASGGVETLLFTSTAATLTTTTAHYDLYSSQSDIAILNTDRIVVKFLATNNAVASRTITFYYEGTTHASHVNTPLVNPDHVGGALNLVTATAVPFVSSAGVLTQDGTDFTYNSSTNTLKTGILDNGGALYNVKVFGAVGDDATNDTAAIQACIDARQAAGGGTCYIPSGIYLIQSLKFWNGATAYSNISLIGDGIGHVVLKTVPGITPSAATTATTIELADPSDLTGTNPTTKITIKDLTLDGNKANVTIPAGGATDDTSHQGILCQQCSSVTISNVEAKNYYYNGVGFGLYGKYNQVSNLKTSNNGYNATLLGYGGIAIQGSSQHNTVTGLISDGDDIGVNVSNNTWYNHVSGVVRNSLISGLYLADGAGGSSHDNVIDLVISGSADIGAILGGEEATGITTGNKIKLVIDSAGAEGIYASAFFLQNTVDVAVRRSQEHGLAWRGSGNLINALLTENGQASALAYYGAWFESTATNNKATLLLSDRQSTTTQQGVWFNGATHNTVSVQGDQLIVYDSRLIRDDAYPLSTNTATGGTLIQNGHFYADISWAKGSSWTITGGAAVCDGSADYDSITQAGILQVGRTYKVTYTIANTAGSLVVQAGSSALGTVRTTSGTFVDYVVADGTGFVFVTQGPRFTGTIDNVSVVAVN